MTFRAILLAVTLAAATFGVAAAQDLDDVPATPVLRPQVMVSGDVVRVGDLVDNAGAFASVAVFRSPDLGTTGKVTVGQVLEALRSHRVIGVDARDVREVVVTHAARTLAARDVEVQVAKALSGRGGLGDAAAIAVTLDRDTGPLQLDASNRGDLNPVATRYDQHNGRFDVVFEVVNETTSAPTRLRYTGTAYETVQTAVLTRSVDRGEVLKTADIVTERRAKADAGNDLATRDLALGMQMRRRVNGGQILRNTDVGKPDLVQRDQNVSIVYQTPGLYLTMRGKATDGGAEGDTVNVVNLQSKRVVQGTVVGPGQVLVAPIAPTITATASPPRDQPTQPESNE
jgi:flagellar basal body P-ring formation protein FlgA